LEHLATSDGLTGLYNRRYLDTSLANELARSQRYGHDMSIIMFDVDHFKQFNDEHGHDQGDRVLQLMSRIVKGQIRTLDIPCRYGGEEFLIILPETNHEYAMGIAERLRKKIEETPLDGLNVTVSIGVASYPAIVVENYQEFIEAADKALYEAKNAGRNCVRSA
jgi:diguanylate cyclase (GGDEF)-like protein